MSYIKIKLDKDSHVDIEFPFGEVGILCQVEDIDGEIHDSVTISSNYPNRINIERIDEKLITLELVEIKEEK